jgi:hypothetical protein
MNMPMKPGYYWAKWRIAADGTHEGDQQTPCDTWEVVQVNANSIDWIDDPTANEALSVSVPGVQKTQWPDCFVWGEFVAPLEQDNGRVWRTDVAAMPKTGREVELRIETTVRAYWDPSLKSWVLVRPLHVESIIEPTKFRVR